MNVVFYRCKHCGKILVLVKDSGTPTVCCGSIMEELIPSSTEGALEKHIPLILKNENIITVRVGKEFHPMTQEHYIEWIMIVTNKGVHKRILTSVDHPYADFILVKGEKVLGAYSYCNLHGLWKNI